MKIKFVLFLLAGTIARFSAIEAQLPQVSANYYDFNFKYFSVQQYVFVEIFRDYIPYPYDLEPEKVKENGLRAIYSDLGKRWHVFDRKGNLTGYSAETMIGKDSVKCTYDEQNRLISRKYGTVYRGEWKEQENTKMFYRSPDRIDISKTDFGREYSSEITLQRDGEDRITEIRVKTQGPYGLSEKHIHKFVYGKFDLSGIQVEKGAYTFDVYFLNPDGVITDEVFFFDDGASKTHVSHTYKPSPAGYSIVSKSVFSDGNTDTRTRAYDAEGRCMYVKISDEKGTSELTYSRTANTEESLDKDRQGNLIRKQTRTFNDAGFLIKDESVSYRREPFVPETFLRKLYFFE